MQPIPFKDSVFRQILAQDIPEISTTPAGVQNHFRDATDFISKIPASLKDHAYAEGKWTLAQVLGHIVDAQAVFLYRILSIARGDSARLPGFDEGIWVAAGNYQASTLPEILGLYQAASRHTESSVLRLRAEDLARTGEANGVLISAEEVLVYLMAHERHHLKVLEERYLPR